MQCRRAIGPWGFSRSTPKTVRWIYNFYMAGVRLTLDLCCHHRLNGLYEKKIALLKIVLRLGNFLITWAFLSSPGTALNAITGTISFYLLIEDLEEAAKGALRLQASNHRIKERMIIRVVTS